MVKIKVPPNICLSFSVLLIHTLLKWAFFLLFFYPSRQTDKIIFQNLQTWQPQNVIARLAETSHNS